MRIKILGNIVADAVSLLQENARAGKMPNARHLRNTFIFRYSLCRHLYGLMTISQGGLQGKTRERLRNDLVDMTFVACATYFDGILSNETKVNEIYKQAQFMLNHGLSQEIRSGHAR